MERHMTTRHLASYTRMEPRMPLTPSRTMMTWSWSNLRKRDTTTQKSILDSMVPTPSPNVMVLPGSVTPWASVTTQVWGTSTCPSTSLFRRLRTTCKCKWVYHCKTTCAMPAVLYPASSSSMSVVKAMLWVPTDQLQTLRGTPQPTTRCVQT